MPPTLAGQRQLGGWIDDRGRFYPVPEAGAHIRIAEALRLTGDGPADAWDMAKSTWCLVKAHGEVLALPGRLSQPQHDSLGDMLIGAPDGVYRSYLLTSLRLLRELETCR